MKRFKPIFGKPVSFGNVFKQLKSSTVTISFSNSSIYSDEDIDITVSIPSDATGYAECIIGNEYYSKQLISTAGSDAVFTVSGLSIGVKNVIVNYLGNNEYRSCNNVGSFEVIGNSSAVINFTTDNSEYDLGDIITTLATVTNDGDIPLTNVVVSSVALNHTWNVGTLNPGSSYTINTYNTRTVSKWDILDGEINCDISVSCSEIISPVNATYTYTLEESNASLVYSGYYSASPASFTTGLYLTAIIQSFANNYGNSKSFTSQQIDDMADELIQSIVTEDDDIDVVSYVFGQAITDGGLGMFGMTLAWCLMDYFAYKIWLIDSSINAWGYIDLDNSRFCPSGYTQSSWQSAGDSPLYVQRDGSTVKCFQYIYSEYISDLEKFLERYVDPVIAEENYSGQCKSVISDFKQQCIDEGTYCENEVYKGSVSIYYGNTEVTQYIAKISYGVKKVFVEKLGDAKEAIMENNIPNAEDLYDLVTTAENGSDYMHIELYVS